MHRYLSIVAIIVFLWSCLPVFSEPETAQQILKDNKNAVVVLINKNKGPKILGYGFIISDKGIVLTTNDIIQDKSFQLKTFNNKKYETEKIILRDLNRNLALLQLSSVNNVPFVQLGESLKLKIGNKLLTFADVNNNSSLDYKYVVVKKLFENSEKQQNIIDMIASGSLLADNKGMPVFNNSGKVVGIISSNSSSSPEEIQAVAISDLQYHKVKLKEHLRDIRIDFSRGSFNSEESKDAKALQVKAEEKAVQIPVVGEGKINNSQKSNTNVEKKEAIKSSQKENKPQNECQKEKSRRSIFFPWKKKKEKHKQPEKPVNKDSEANKLSKKEITKIANTKTPVGKAANSKPAGSLELGQQIKKKKTRRSIFFPWRKIENQDVKAEKDPSKALDSTSASKKPATIIIKTDKNSSTTAQSVKPQSARIITEIEPVDKPMENKEPVKVATAIDELSTEITHKVDHNNNFSIDLSGYWFDIETGLNISIEKQGNILMMNSLTPALGDSKTLETTGSFKKTDNIYVGNMMSSIKCKNSFFNKSSLKDCSINEKVEILYWDNNKIDLSVYTIIEYDCRQCSAPTGYVWKPRTWLRKAKK